MPSSLLPTRKCYQSLSKSAVQSTLALLASGAFFSPALVGGEYLKVTGLQNTKQLGVVTSIFLVPAAVSVNFNYLDTKSTAVLDVITFCDQNNKKKMDQLTMSHTTNPLLCLVRLWLQIVKNVQCLSRADINSPICTYFSTYFNPKVGHLF
jgi:hypothetical protein